MGVAGTRDPSRRVGVRTVPVVLGVAGTRRLCLTLCLGVALAATVAGGGFRVPFIAAALMTAAYARLLPVRSGRLEYALAVDGVPALLGVCVLAF